jgi:hypothetical protein
MQTMPRFEPTTSGKGYYDLDYDLDGLQKAKGNLSPIEVIVLNPKGNTRLLKSKKTRSGLGSGVYGVQSKKIGIF